jgi:hypothetical protein
VAVLATLAGFGTAEGQSLGYEPEQGESFRYRTRNQLTVTQQILESENHYTLRAEGVVRLTLMNPGPRLLWRLGYEELSVRIEGAFPSPRVEELRGTVVTLATTPQGVVLDALASGVVSPGIGGQYVERAAAAFLPRLPERSGQPGTVWTDTLLVTEVLQGVTAEVTTILQYTIADTSALAGRAVLPVEYTGTISVTGSGLIDGSRVAVEGSGRVRGHYLFDPADRVFDLHEQEQVLESTLTLVSPDQRTVGIPSRQVLNARSERLF